MSLPDGMKLIDLDEERPFFTLRSTFISFSIKSVKMLGYAPYVHVYLDEKRRTVAFQACEEDGQAVEFYHKPEQGKQALIRIASKKLCQKLMEMGGKEVKTGGIRYYGTFLEEDRALLFALSHGEPCHIRS